MSTTVSLPVDGSPKLLSVTVVFVADVAVVAVVFACVQLGAM